MNGRRVATGVCLAAMLAVLPTALLAQNTRGDDSFRAAMKARETGLWAAVARGMRAAIMADAKESIRRVNSALGSVLSLGKGGDPYLPYFFLGEALHKQQDCLGALVAWEESDRQGITRKERDRADVIDAGYEDCDKRGFVGGPTLTKENDDLRGALERARASGREFGTPDQGRPEFQSIQQALRQVAAAEQRLGDAQKSRRREDFAEVRRVLVSASVSFGEARETIAEGREAESRFDGRARAMRERADAIDGRAAGLEGQLAGGAVRLTMPDNAAGDRRRAVEAVSQARVKIDAGARTRSERDLQDASALLDTAERYVESAGSLITRSAAEAVTREMDAIRSPWKQELGAVDLRVQMIIRAMTDRPMPPELAKEFDAANRELGANRRRFERAAMENDLANARRSVAAVQRLIPRFDKVIEALQLNRPELPESLRQGAQAFLGGDYAGALRVLTDETTATIAMPFRIHAHLFRAAAAFALAQREGQAGAAFIAQARRDADAVRQLDRGFTPMREAFSPRFIEFLKGSAPPQ